MRGVGPKTAISLLKEHQDLVAVYVALEEVEAEGAKASRGAIKGALKGKLRSDKDNAYLSRKLAEILVDIPLPEEPTLPLKEVDREGLSARLEDLELNSLLRQVNSFAAAFSEGGFGANADSIQPVPAHPSQRPPQHPPLQHPQPQHPSPRTPLRAVKAHHPLREPRRARPSIEGRPPFPPFNRC